MNKKNIIRLAFAAVTLLLTGYWLMPRHTGEAEAAPIRDYAEIAASGMLRVSTEYNNLSYHVMDDTITGFHYELIEAFAQAHGLKVEIHPDMDFDHRLRQLRQGATDLVAYQTLANIRLKDSFLLTEPILLSKQVLVQRKDSLMIKSQLDLAGKKLHVVAHSPVIERIHHLGNEIGDTIYISEIDKYGPEQLIALVAHGDIDYAVADEYLAQAMTDSLPNLDVSTAISFTQFYSWVVNRESPVLRDSINSWLSSFKHTRAYREIYRRYYK